ncbi:ABC1 family-domain containing protein [Nitzschia inconspicua]|uniref:ABC1 family-domain containing protein n=1 Tax=Nitzschia inconspicua TaxID=303405 RepID=A0A9K3KAP1_9STRA|nr:ABC1 family-domain containing protein [Nitzschia inconspicua]
MASRFTTTVLLSQRFYLHRRTAIAVSAGGVISLGAAVASSSLKIDSSTPVTTITPRWFFTVLDTNPRSITKCDDQQQQQQQPAHEGPIIQSSSSSPQSLWIPSLQAGIRALRLVKTTICIVWDYEVAKLERHLPFNSTSQEDAEIQALEAKVEQKEKALEEAQTLYARGDNTDNNREKDESKNSRIDDLQSIVTPEKIRKENKRQQKIRMQQAAQELADAEAELTSKEGQSSKRALHRKSAQRLLQLCRDNGGVYIKVGQHLANLDYLIPSEYIDVLSSLFNDAPRSSFDDVAKVIEEDLGAPIDALFDNFDPVPIASASLAQVHVAYDKETKEKLAVKVQHRGLRETSAGDIHAVCFVVGVLDSFFRDFTFGWIADEMAPQLPKELDFTLEGRNAEKAAADMKGSGLACCIPKIFWKDSSPRVLTMKFEEGFKSTDIDAIQRAGLKKSDVAKLISSVFSSQMFLSGFVHVDPHPANVLIRSKNGKPEMVLVDHGLYKQLDDNFRLKYSKLWKSLMMADLKGIEESCASMGVTKMYPLFAAMLTARPYDEIIERSRTGSFQTPVSNRSPESQADRAVIRGYAKQFLSEIFALLGVLPRQMLLLLKMNDCLRHIDMTLDTPTNTLVIAGKYASKALYLQQWQESKSSVIGKMNAWLSYIRVLVRINIYEIGVWLHAPTALVASVLEALLMSSPRRRVMDK